jgi:nitroimidazol reductase NimA-like FMN-containing flavoprotein (pyridoxamine 5'-phosphate oxidase superfamily)
MRIQTLSIEECVDFLRDRSLGRLACSHLDQPYVVPIHFALEPERRRIYAFSSVGQKIEWMRKNPAVCIEIDDVTDKDHWTTVLVFGRYRELERRPEDAEERRIAGQLLQKRPEWWLPAAGKVVDYEHPDVVLYSIDGVRFTGRRVDRAV